MGVINGVRQFFSSIYALKDVIVGRKITTDGTDLVLQPDAGQITRVGSGTFAHLAGNNDLGVGGVTQLNGSSYIKSTMFFQAHLYFDAASYVFGMQVGGLDAALLIAVEANSFNLAINTNRNQVFVLTSYANRAAAHGHGMHDDPGEYIHSGTDLAVDDTQFIGFLHNKTDARVMAGKGGVVTSQTNPVELADDASFDLPDASAGFGTFLVGDGEEYTTVHWTSAGVVTLGGDATANVVSTDTDTNFCIFDNGTAVRVRNRLGSAKKIVFNYTYTTP